MQTLSITVTNDNDPLVANNDTYFAVEETTLTVPAPGIKGNDSSEDTALSAVTIQLVAGPANGILQSLDLLTGAFSYKANTNFFGQDKFTYKLTHGTGVSNTATVLINVANVNDAPALSVPLPDMANPVGNFFSFTILGNTFTDPDGDSLTYSATLADGSPLPSWLTFNPTTRTFSGTPLAANVGVIQIRVTATDPSLQAISDVFQISVFFSVPTTPHVESIVLNDGQAQRSKLSKVTITFDMLVNVAPNAITIERRDDSPGAPFTVGMVANVVQAITTVSGKTVVTLTFTPSNNPSLLFPDIAGSLKDGNYQVTLDDLGITSVAGGQILDGNNDSLPGGDKVFGNAAVDRFYRLYGDNNGDGFVDLTDLNALVAMLTQQTPYREWLDKNGDGFVDLTDLNAFVANMLNNNIRNINGF